MCWMFTKLTVVIFAQHIHLSHHNAVHFKVIQCHMSIISRKLRNIFQKV